MNTLTLSVTPLDRSTFSPFGDVIELAGAVSNVINDGTARRFSNLASIDVAFGGGRAALHVYRARPRPFPIRISAMERHPLGSQAFVSLDQHPFVVVVSPDEAGRPGPPRAFLASAGQGVNYRRGTWHHPLLVLRDPSHFLVVDREGPGANLEERTFAGAVYEVVRPANADPARPP